MQPKATARLAAICAAIFFVLTQDMMATDAPTPQIWFKMVTNVTIVGDAAERTSAAAENAHVLT